MVDPWLAGVAVIDTASNRRVSLLKVSATDLVVSPDSTRLYAALANQLSIVDLASGKVVATLTIAKQSTFTLNSLVVSADGQRVYVANAQNNTVAVVDPTADQVIATIKVGSFPSSMALQPDGQRLFVANSQGKTISVIDTARNQVIETLHLPGSPRALIVSPDGRSLYVGHGDASDSMFVISTATLGLFGSELSIPGGHASALAVTPDTKRLYLISTQYPIVAAVDLTGPIVSGVVVTGPRPVSLALSPDGRRLYTADADSGTVTVLDTATLQVTAAIDVKKK
jgi:YVTN family beta-propeller protein